MKILTVGLIGLVSIFTIHCKAQQAFYVSPTGTATGDGSITRPWDLTTALRHPSKVTPGSVIWLRGGKYSGTFVSLLNGTPSAPIIVRQYANERATLDGGLEDGVVLAVAGSYTWFWGFEITATGGDRFASTNPELRRAAGVTNAQYPGMGVGCKFINVLIHDTLLGFGWWRDAQNSELYGNIIYNNGWDMTDRGHGHGIYAQNETGTMRISENIVFNQFGEGITLYGSATAPLNNFFVSGNIVFDNGAISAHGFTRNLLVGGGKPAQNPTVVDNYTYYPDRCCGTNDIGYVGGCTNLNLSRNYFANGGDTALTLGYCSVTALSGNTFFGHTYGFNSAVAPDNTYHASRPTTNKIVVRPNTYEVGRANIVIYNWTRQTSVAVDISTARIPLGRSYTIRNVQNYFGPTLKGTYTGAPVNIPMSGWTVAAPDRATTPPSTFPEFGAFVITMN
jgi:hypothetical protein